MNSARIDPCFSRTLCAALATFFLVAAAPSVVAQSALEQIAQIRSEAASGSANDQTDEIDKLARFRQRLRREAEISELLARALEQWRAAREVESQAKLQQSVAEQFAQLEVLAGDVEARVVQVRKKSADAAPSKRLEFEYRLRDYDELLSELYGIAVTNGARADALDLDAASALATLDSRLAARAQAQANGLRKTLTRIDAATLQAETAGDSASADLELEIVVLEERRRRLKSSLDRSVDLLKKRELDASEYVRLLFQSTGVVSSDLFDADVLRGLVSEWGERARATLVAHGPAWIFRIVVFVLILAIARFLGKLASRVVDRLLSSARVRLSSLMQEFFVKLTANLVFLLGALVALSQLGVNLGPVLAGLGIAGFIVGFALQDTLSNFASGMMILLYRPYDVGDVVEAAGVSGKVQKMSLVSTTITTFDNQQLVVPNNKIWGDVIRNVNAAPNRRVDLTFGIGYDDDIAQAEAVLKEIIDAHELVLDEPEPTIKLHNLGDSSVDFIVRPWVRAADYWTVYWDVTRAVKERFDAAGISIPYPQRDVHVYQENND